MSRFGEPTAPPPARIEDLVGSELMARLDQVDVVSRKIFAGKLQGERRSKKRGISAEFADYRHYAHGDDLRFIDWNIYARLDRLFLKIFLEEEDLSLVVAIDASASMHWGNPSKFAFAQRLAMSLGYIGLVNRNRVSVHAFSADGLRSLTGLRGRRRTRELGTWLLSQKPSGASGFEDALRRIALSRQGRGVLLVISDFLLREGYEAGLRYVSGGGFDVFAVQTLAPEEIDPARHGLAGDLRLVDVEDGAVAEITVGPALLARYKANLDAHCGALREYCVRRGIVHLLVDTATDMETLLLETMRRRGLLR